MEEPLIELKGVSKKFGDKVILDGLNLSIYRNQALVIIGPSGTGKSTVLRIIAGLTAPDEGEIYVKGKLRTGLAEDNRESLRIALVFQQSALFDSLTVEENVGFSLFEHSRLSHKKIKEIVAEKLRLVGLDDDISERYPAQLSGGMRKRVSFARAIINNPENPQENPEIILYDEPTAGLDPIASTIIEDLVRKIQKDSGTCASYVMVSHQSSTIRRTAKRIVFLYKGQTPWSGTVQEIDTTDNEMIRQFFSGSIEGPIKATD
ncbi:MAG: putative ribonucleotide transport ATP-binding protein mkl [Chroococcopsis gigantea SAG 12.99]|jgi:phospholipid/cholesterol/gamma-HCH transport system ATP-binding protein|nr:ATP-binding cassette domain-containing protein [Chlorogloea purpurea SAG 13.99]MDV2998905.1 putative ribonucleotide transport ATP-binding protein mkl [Chroococcopsis gigantea SAG 12.99]